ncbi:MAG: hypothetical protein ABI407_22810 [Bradyrhizobium sp.]
MGYSNEKIFFQSFFILHAASICENGKYSIGNPEVFVFIESRIKLGLSGGKISFTNAAPRRSMAEMDVGAFLPKPHSGRAAIQSLD